MAEKTKAQLEQELEAALAHIQSIRAPFIKAKVITDETTGEQFIVVLNSLIQSQEQAAEWMVSIRKPLLDAAIVDGRHPPEVIIKAIENLVATQATHGDEVKRLQETIDELRAHPPMLIDGETGSITPVDSFAAEARRSVAEGVPANPHGIPEEQIREKRAAGLTRDQAIEVILRQSAEDNAKSS